MPPAVELIRQRDFTGGVNFRSDQFQLAPNESPEMLNMDVDPRGGVRTRPGVSVQIDTPDIPYAVAQWHSETDSRLWVADAQGDAWLVQGYDTWTSVATSATSTPWRCATQFKKNLYMQNGAEAPRRWNGTTTSNLTQLWAEDFAAPGSGNMPIARRMAVHHGHMWLADTLESATRHPDRLRFSHPNQAEAWRSLDWIDLDPGVNAESIVELVPYQDHLLAFKANSVYAIFGFGWDSWSKQSVSREVGCVGVGAAVATPAGVYFFDWPNGVMRWNGRNVEWAFERLAPAIRDGNILSSRRDEIRMGWADNRLWVSVPWGGDETRLLVLDPSLGKEGSWVIYDVPAGFVFEYEDPGATIYLGASLTNGVMYNMVVNGQQTDELLPEVHSVIKSRYRTRWFDADVDAMRKRFRRLWVTFWGDGEGELGIDLFVNYDNAQRRKSWTETILNQTSNQKWDTPGLEWDSGQKWGQEGTHHEIERGVSLGNAHSVQMLFRGPTDGGPWGIESITLPYTRRRVR